MPSDWKREQTLERQGLQFYKQAQRKTRTLETYLANISEIIYFSFQLSSCVWLNMKITGGGKKHRRLIFAGRAVLTGAALRVLLWPFCCAPWEAVQPRRAQRRAPFQTCHQTNIHPFQFSFQKPSVVCGIGIF